MQTVSVMIPHIEREGKKPEKGAQEKRDMPVPASWRGEDIEKNPKKKARVCQLRGQDSTYTDCERGKPLAPVSGAAKAPMVREGTN